MGTPFPFRPTVREDRNPQGQISRARAKPVISGLVLGAGIGRILGHWHQVPKGFPWWKSPEDKQGHSPNPSLLHPWWGWGRGTHLGRSPALNPQRAGQELCWGPCPGLGGCCGRAPGLASAWASVCILEPQLLLLLLLP